MTGRVVRTARHDCTPGPISGRGEIWQCGCGRYWISRAYPNPDYDHWSRLTWLGRKIRGIS